MGDIGKFYSYGCYKSNSNIKSTAKKTVYENDIELLDNSDGTYTLSVKGKEIGVITASTETTSGTFVANAKYDSDNNVINFYSSDGTVISSVDTSEFTNDGTDNSVSYEAGNGINISDNTISVAKSSLSEDYLTVDENGIAINGVDTAISEAISSIDYSNYATAADLNDAVTTLETADNSLQEQITANADNITALETTITTEASERKAADKALQEAIDSLVGSDSVDEDYGTISEIATALATLNGDSDTEGSVAAAVAAEASERETADEEIAEDTVSLDAIIKALEAKIAVLEEKVSATYTSSLTTVELESVEDGDGSVVATLTSEVASSLESDGEYYISGASIATTSSDTITASTIVIEDCTLEDDTRLNIVAETVEIDGLTISGSFLKATQNSIISINNATSVVFKDCTFDMSSGYNVAEINLGSSYDNLPSTILFDNCQFTGTISNNAITIFGTAENATVTLNECYFESVSNALRISNRTDASGVVFNIINCTVEQWDSSPKYQGFCICQDYTSGSYSASLESNLFAPDKITFNFNNLVHAGEKVTCDDLSTICGIGSDGETEGQVFYVRNYSTTVPYGDGEYYPTIIFK